MTGRTKDPNNLAVQLLHHASKLAAETGFSPDPAVRENHPSYRAIIALAGADREAVVTFLIGRLAAGSHWFAALREIAGEDPVRLAHKCSFGLAAADWAEWHGRARAAP